MKILYLDTSSQNYNISIFDNDKLLIEEKGVSDQNLSQYLVEIVSSLFKKINISAKDIDKIAVIDGPGSFTGIRMGVSVAKVFAWALDKEIISFSKLFLLASNLEASIKMPIIHARADDYYFGIYDGNNNVIVKDTHGSKEKIIEMINEHNPKIISIAENFTSSFYEEKPNKVINYIINSKGNVAHSINPNYLKITQAEANLND